MSVDESNNTSIALNETVTTEMILKTNKPGKSQINLIGTFLLGLYHRSLITIENGWCIKKTDLQKEYENFINCESKEHTECVSTANIDTLLHQCGFLIDTLPGDNFYKIRCLSLFKFRNNKIKELDDLKKNNTINTQNTPKNISLNSGENPAKLLLQDNIEVDESEPKLPLMYQGTAMKQRSQHYCDTNTSCFICEEQFSTISEFEEHIQKHGEGSDFEYLSLLKKIDNPIFTLNYRLCIKSHHFCFEIETFSHNLMVEKIVIVKSRSFYYVNNKEVPFEIPQNGRYRFFVDSHMFTRHVEQPIVIICYIENNKETRIIEQHHFMRSEEFPKVHFATSPYRLPNKITFKQKYKLADYFPPKEIQDSLKDKFYYEKLIKISNEFRDYVQSGKRLQPATIDASLNILLQIEDIDTLEKYLSLTQKNVKLRKFENEYSFRLNPKHRIFIENILSACDEVVLTQKNIFNDVNAIKKLMMQNTKDLDNSIAEYVGQIIAINTGRISFKCDRKININAKYTIICRPSRLNIRYQFRCLQFLPIKMKDLKKFLFPVNIIPMPLSTVRLQLYNDKIALIPEQLQAVRNIAEGPRNDATYIIFGPPGTGKTTTVVESILQVLKKPNTKILVTAGSNSACDEIALRLSKYLKKLDIKRCLARIYARSAEEYMDTVDDDLLEHSNMYCGQFYPDIGILHEYRIVVCTNSVVAKLSTGKFGRCENGNSVYTHLFIDEVAASMEAESLMTIISILSAESCLIISGDHKQLGPILQSKRAQEFGLDVSLMERLLERDCYRVDSVTGDYDRTIQTRLCQNYRSHPAIVKLYSGLYYSHNVKSFAKMEDVSLGDDWYKIRNKNFPIIFHAIYESSTSDNQSSSLYNLGELNVVMDYVKDLMYFGINGKPVKENNIGIISPYKKQYKLIREELNLRKWFNITTGSVETFQGKEKDIIIVSFVRSGTKKLGFLENPRRLNVTLSRPKSILILIGNPQTLSLNSEFDYIINECKRHNTFVGSSKTQKNSKENLAILNEKLQELYVSSGNGNENNKRIDVINSTLSSIDSIRSPKMDTILNEIKEKNHNRNGYRKRLKAKGKSKVKSTNSANIDIDKDDDSDKKPLTSSDTPDSDKTSEIINETRHKNPTNRSKMSAYDGKSDYIKDKQKTEKRNTAGEEISKLFDELPKVPKRKIENSPISTSVHQKYYNEQMDRLPKSFTTESDLSTGVNKHPANMSAETGKLHQNLTKSEICPIKPLATNFSYNTTTTVKVMSGQSNVKSAKEKTVQSDIKTNSSKITLPSKRLFIANVSPMPRLVSSNISTSVSRGSHQNYSNNYQDACAATVKEKKYNSGGNMSNISFSTSNNRTESRLATAKETSTSSYNQYHLIKADEAFNVLNSSTSTRPIRNINIHEQKSKNKKENKRCTIS